MSWREGRAVDRQAVVKTEANGNVRRHKRDTNKSAHICIPISSSTQSTTAHIFTSSLLLSFFSEQSFTFWYNGRTLMHIYSVFGVDGWILVVQGRKWKCFLFYIFGSLTFIYLPLSSTWILYYFRILSIYYFFLTIKILLLFLFWFLYSPQQTKHCYISGYVNNNARTYKFFMVSTCTSRQNLLRITYPCSVSSFRRYIIEPLLS